MLPPFQENATKQLQQIYEQLYPTFLISHFPLFYKEFGRVEFGRVEIAGDIVVGSVKRGQNSRSSSVVMGGVTGLVQEISLMQSTTGA